MTLSNSLSARMCCSEMTPTAGFIGRYDCRKIEFWCLPCQSRPAILQIY